MLLYKTRCPKCAEEGRDKRGDNLAVYENGAYCFSCGYYSSTNTNVNLPRRKDKDISLPEDVTTKLPIIAEYWLDQYEITSEEIKQNNLLWSSSKQYLIFPIFIENNLEAWLGRYFGDKNEHPKWITYGINNSLYYINYSRTSTNVSSIVLVEDIVSAIKVSRFVNCMPLFNAHISKQRLAKLQELGYTDLFIWLDPNKRKESLHYADWANLYGFKTKVIFSDKDPKECNESFILNQISI